MNWETAKHLLPMLLESMNESVTRKDEIDKVYESLCKFVLTQAECCWKGKAKKRKRTMYKE